MVEQFLGGVAEILDADVASRAAVALTRQGCKRAPGSVQCSIAVADGLDPDATLEANSLPADAFRTTIVTRGCTRRTTRGRP